MQRDERDSVTGTRAKGRPDEQLSAPSRSHLDGPRPADAGSGLLPSEQLNSAIAKARKIRGSLIDLGYEIPEGAPKAVLNAWSTADRGLYELISALEEDSRS